MISCFSPPSPVTSSCGPQPSFTCSILRGHEATQSPAVTQPYLTVFALFQAVVKDTQLMILKAVQQILRQKAI